MGLDETSLAHAAYTIHGKLERLNYATNLMNPNAKAMKAKRTRVNLAGKPTCAEETAQAPEPHRFWVLHPAARIYAEQVSRSDLRQTLTGRQITHAKLQ